MKGPLLLFACVACVRSTFAAEPPHISAFPLRIEVTIPVEERSLPVSIGPSEKLRGFKFRDVGQRDISGAPAAGSTLASPAIQYTFPIIEKVRGAVFYDIGFVNWGEYDFSIFSVNDADGVRMRLDLPIGPVRLDYGIPMGVEKSSDKRHWPNLDAPGPGYREQRERFRLPR